MMLGGFLEAEKGFEHIYLCFLTNTTFGSNLREFLLEGLTVLKNRGYDSAGLATMPSTGGSMVSCL